MGLHGDFVESHQNHLSRRPALPEVHDQGDERKVKKQKEKMLKMKKAFVLLSLSLFLGLPLAAAEDVPDLTAAEENSILKMQHEADVLGIQVKDVQGQFVQLQNQARQLQDKFNELSKAQQDAEKKVQAAVDAVYRAHNLDEKKAAFDRSTLKFSWKKAEEKPEKEAPNDAKPSR